MRFCKFRLITAVFMKSGFTQLLFYIEILKSGIIIFDLKVARQWQKSKNMSTETVKTKRLMKLY